MASDDEACTSEKKPKLDPSSAINPVQTVNETFKKIDNLEHFPESVLTRIFTKLRDADLLSVADTCCRFETIVKVILKDRYTNRSFVFDGERQEQRKLYEDLFTRYGYNMDIKAIDAKHIYYINESHWLTKLLQQYTNELQKITFDNCFFDTRRDNILFEHITVEHLSLRLVGGGFISIPAFKNLSTLKLYNVRIMPDMYPIVHILRINPGLESLTMQFTKQFNATPVTTIYFIAEKLKYLKELHLMNATDDQWDYYTNNHLAMIVNSFKNLESLTLDTHNEDCILLDRLSLACKNLKTLGLIQMHRRNSDYNAALIQAIGQCKAVETLNLAKSFYSGAIKQIVERLPKLRQLYLAMEFPPDNFFILNLLRRNKSLETITIDFVRNTNMQNFMNMQFYERFCILMRRPNGRIEFKIKHKKIGIVTKHEMVWGNVLVHWDGYDACHNSSNINLLDLAKPLNASSDEARAGTSTAPERRKPIDFIFDYLDLSSLYNLSQTCKQSSQLVDTYVKRHSQENRTFIISDKFHCDDTILDAFAEHVEDLNLHLSHSNCVSVYLSLVQNSFENLRNLSIRSENTYKFIYEYRLPQIRKLILNFDAFDIDRDTFDLYKISKIHPNLETLEIQNKAYMTTENDKPLEFRNLKTFAYRYIGETQSKLLKHLFKDTETKLIPKFRRTQLANVNESKGVDEVLEWFFFESL